jgi:hypothetical protein
VSVIRGGRLYRPGKLYSTIKESDICCYVRLDSQKIKTQDLLDKYMLKNMFLFRLVAANMMWL